VKKLGILMSSKQGVGGEEGMPLCAQRMTAVVYHRSDFREKLFF
jgi:hypothetical protein